jgi:hypothetical protein
LLSFILFISAIRNNGFLYAQNLLGGIMKKVISLLVLSLVLTGTAVFGQNASGLDFSSTAPQFFSFDIGAAVGYALDSEFDSQIKGATVVGFKVAVIDSLEVGIDTLSTIDTSGASTPPVPVFAGLRIAYRFTPTLGVAIGVGQAGVIDNGTSAIQARPGITLGAFYDIFAKRSSNGIATALKIRVDYVARTDDIAKGALFFSPVFTLGL